MFSLPTVVNDGSEYVYCFKSFCKNGGIDKTYSLNPFWEVPHRLCGPAIEFSDGRKHWYYKGKKIKCSSQAEFEKILKLKVFW